MAGCLRHVGRRGLLLSWHGPAPAIPPRHCRFWGTAATAAAAILVTVPVLPTTGRGPGAHGVRILAALVAALLAAAGAAALPTTNRMPR